MSSPSKENRSREEQRVERWSVEALADERRGTDDEHTFSGLGLGEAVRRGSPVACRDSALQDERLMSARGQQGRESFHVRDPSGKHEAVAPTAQCGIHIGDDLGVACLVRDESAVQFGERRGARQVDAVGAELGLVDIQHPSRSCVRRPGVHEGARIVLGHRVPDRSELPGDEFRRDRHAAPAWP